MPTLQEAIDALRGGNQAQAQDIMRGVVGLPRQSNTPKTPNWTDYLAQQGITGGGDDQYYMRDERAINPDEIAPLQQQWQQGIQAESRLPWFEDITAQGYQPSPSAQAWNRFPDIMRTNPELLGLIHKYGIGPGSWGENALTTTDPLAAMRSAGSRADQLIRAAQDRYDSNSGWSGTLNSLQSFLSEMPTPVKIGLGIIGAGAGGFIPGVEGVAGAGGATAAGDFSFPTFDTGPGYGESLTSLMGGDTTGEAGYDGGGATIDGATGQVISPAPAGSAEDMFNTYGQGLTANEGGAYSSGGITPAAISAFLKDNPWAASLGINAISAIIGAYGANRAAGIQSDAARNANNTLMEMFNRNEKRIEPWTKVGGAAITRAGQIMEPGGGQKLLEMDPGYAFRLAEGNKAIDRAAAARGMFDSGPTLKGLTRYGQDYASGEFGNAYNRLLALAGMGQTATSNTGAQGTNVAGQIAANQIGTGNVNAAANLSGYGAVTNSLSNFLRQQQEQPFYDAILGRINRG